MGAEVPVPDYKIDEHAPKGMREPPRPTGTAGKAVELRLTKRRYSTNL